MILALVLIVVVLITRNRPASRYRWWDRT